MRRLTIYDMSERRAKSIVVVNISESPNVRDLRRSARVVEYYLNINLLMCSIVCFQGLLVL